MEQHEKIDDQMLGAFVDGLLDAEHSVSVINAIDEDPDIRERVYRLRRSKDLMRLAYGSATPAETPEKPLRSGRLPVQLAASLGALAISFAAGMFGPQYLETRTADLSAAVTEARQTESARIILHVSQSDPQQFEAALAYTEKFLNEHDNTDQIEVVAHARGLDMLRADISPVRDRVVSLMKQHGNVHFIGCAGAIRTYTLQQGTPPRIIEGVDTDMTAFDHIVGRLQSGGWRYIKVETLPEA